MLSEVNHHWVNLVDNTLQSVITQLTLTQAQRSTLGRASGTLIIADGPVTILTSATLVVAEISTLLLATWAFPLSAVTCV